MKSSSGSLLPWAIIWVALSHGVDGAGPAFARVGARSIPYSNLTAASSTAATLQYEPSSTASSSIVPSSLTRTGASTSTSASTSNNSSSTNASHASSGYSTGRVPSINNTSSTLRGHLGAIDSTTITLHTTSPKSGRPLPSTTQPPLPPQSYKTCVAQDTITEYTVTHPYTTTITGNISDYTPPYPQLTLPATCVDADPFRNLRPTSMEELHSTRNEFIHGSPVLTTQKVTAGGWVTDKNPVVVYSTPTPPTYGGPPTVVNDHQAVTDGGSAKGAPGNLATSTPTPVRSTQGGDGGEPGPPPVTVVVQPSQVVINGQTFVDNPQSQTSTVVVGQDTFVIAPTDVVGAGATVARPPPSPGPAAAAPVQTTTVGGLQVLIGPAAVTIDGSGFAIGPSPTTAVIQGQTISIGPAGIGFGSQTLPLVGSGGPTTKVEIVGGELVTAIGPSVLVVDSTTITYGRDLQISTTVIRGETILLSSPGVSAHGSTLGGITAHPTDTAYAMVGGATITAYGSTAAVIGGSTYRIGPGVTGFVTTVVGGQTLTIGANGVSTSTQAIVQPEASTTVILRKPAGTSTAASAGETAAAAAAASGASNSGGKQRDNAAPGVRPDRTTTAWAVCIAIGVWVFGNPPF